MNEFIEQFLIESRELVDRATDDLLALEKSPTDKERLAGAFRGFHTLKGGATIVEFAAMGRALHLVESALDEVRAGKRPITAAFIGDCLTSLDQVVQWLDEIQDSGDLPAAPEAGEAAIVARFAPAGHEAAQSARPDDRMNDDGWLSAVLAAHPEPASRAKTAIRYRPDAQCFFTGRDPLAIVAGLPGLLSLDIQPARPWPTLDELDPFACNLVLTVLTEDTLAQATTALGAEAAHCRIEALEGLERRDRPAGPAGPEKSGEAGPSLQRDLLQQARELLDAQVALLDAETGARGSAGRMASAAAVAVNVMRRLGRKADADRMAEAAGHSLAANTTEPLRREIAAAFGAAAPAATRAAASADTPAAVAGARHEAAAQTLRVDAARIDALVSLTGELTVAKNAIGHVARLAQDEGNVLALTLKARHALLERLIGELQRSVLGMRILPMRHVFQRFPRLIREISAQLGKPANLVLEGEDTEADKAIVEILFEPLLHVLRNSMDHGIEDAAGRAAAGKPATATVRMRAAREGEHVIVEIADDGRGIDVAGVREVARERNVASAEELAAMDDAQVIDLIFAPGFSTASEVTALSGRGVGMDAVRTAVRRLGGQVEVNSVAGTGTTVRFVLPFSVMMTQVMIVEAGGQKFGIPLDAIVETLRVERHSIAPVGAAFAIVLRDRTIPLVDLAGVLGVREDRQDEDSATLVIANLHGELGALRVDRLADRMEIMLKPLEGLLAGMPAIAGSTLLGDGSVLLVLDLEELLQ